MTVYTLQAPMPALRVFDGMIVRLEAIDPTTGDAVTGVVASAWAIYGDDLAEAAIDNQGDVVGPFMLVPGPDSAVA